jgi:predicted signal transduction protein with EAL and GGDEF domain
MNIIETEFKLWGLIKAEPSLQDALKAIRTTHPEHAKTIARHIYADNMIPTMGNKTAYREFLQKPRKGVYVHADLNDFGQINKLHGDQKGDEAIKTFGKLSSGLSRKFGGKSHRPGGDEFKFYFDKPEQALGFSRELQQHLGKLPKVGGTHNIAASIGMGANPEHAEQSLMQAKSKLGPTVNGKRQNTHSVGNAPTVVHSEHAENLLKKPKELNNPLEKPSIL